MSKAKDDRISCPYCGIKTWMRDRPAFMRDHDRPDGRVCRKAQEVQALHDKWSEKLIT